MNPATNHVLQNYLYYFFGIFGAFTAFLMLWERRAPYTFPAKKNRRIITNYAIAFLNFVIALGVPFSSIYFAQIFQNHGLGFFNKVHAPSGVILAVATLSSSFIFWCHHRCLHRFPWLWKIHRLHHSDAHLDVSSTLRIHTLEMYSVLILEIPMLLIFGTPAWALLFAKLIMMPIHLFNHSNISLSADWNRRLKYLIVTPNIHRLHHTRHPDFQRRNFATEIALWDHLFSTRIEWDETRDDKSFGA